jgi:hypothetical protein
LFKKTLFLNQKENLREHLDVGSGGHDDQLEVPELVESVAQHRQQEVGKTISLVYLKERK